GDVAVLATPRVVALCEQATVAVVADSLDASSTTVGTHVSVDHRRPTLPGATVVARATLRAVDGSRLEFDVEVTEAGTVVAAGNVSRSVVDRSRFPGARRDQ